MTAVIEAFPEPTRFLNFFEFGAGGRSQVHPISDGLLAINIHVYDFQSPAFAAAVKAAKRMGARWDAISHQWLVWVDPDNVERVMRGLEEIGSTCHQPVVDMLRAAWESRDRVPRCLPAEIADEFPDDDLLDQLADLDAQMDSFQAHPIQQDAL